jgi:hypothetical protein
MEEESECEQSLSDQKHNVSSVRPNVTESQK